MECFSTNITTIPIVPDECNGDIKSTNCVVNVAPLPYINLPANSKQSLINETLVLALQSAITRIIALENP